MLLNKIRDNEIRQFRLFWFHEIAAISNNSKTYKFNEDQMLEIISKINLISWFNDIKNSGISWFVDIRDLRGNTGYALKKAEFKVEVQH